MGEVRREKGKKQKFIPSKEGRIPANRKWISGEQERKREKRILNPPTTGLGAI